MLFFNEGSFVNKFDERGHVYTIIVIILAIISAIQ